MRRPDSTPLLALLNATAEWRAGLSSRCSAHVRVLDRVHLAVYAGDCIVVHHHDPAGARVLLAALGGHPALAAGRRFSGDRRCAPGVRVRRCAIGPEAAEAVRAGWQRLSGVGTGRASVRRVGADPVVAGGGSRGAVVHLMRVSRRRSLAGGVCHQWDAWARHAAGAGDALVLVTRPDAQPAAFASGAPPFAGEETADFWRDPLRMHESAAPAYEGTAPVVTTAGRAMGAGARELLLHHGRLLTVRRCD